MQWRHATQAARRARCGRGRRAGARLVVVVDEVADEVGDVLVDHQDRDVLALRVVLERVLHLLHGRLCAE